ncbi:MAG: RNase adapter RapZ [Acidimicrobiia bacterium]|nr:RNase adapter RapZ [Acidimicrobiia bacterium]
MENRPQVVVVTGMSGAGRSTAAKVLEDLGYSVIDNLPPSLIPEVIRIRDVPESGELVGLVIDARSGYATEDIRAPLYNLRGLGITVALAFLDADDAVLIKRYEENRRPHPISAETIPEAILQERTMMADLRAMADVVIDTSDYNVHDLRRRIEQEFQDVLLRRRMRVSLRSFGFKHGNPRDADLVFDVRFLPNPHWEEALRPLTGVDLPVREFVMGNRDAATFVDSVAELLSFLIPRFEEEGKSYLSIGIGCTGGRHRSVAIAEELAGRLRGSNANVSVHHRDKDRH